MRILSFVFIIVFAISVSAQTKQAKKLFKDGTQAARTGNYEKALRDYQKAVLLSENDKTVINFLSKTHFNIGVCFYHLNRQTEAVKELNKAIELSEGNYHKAFYVLGMAETELKNWRNATAAFRKAVNLKINDGEAWFDLGLALLEEKNFGEAEKAFQNSIRYKSVAAADAHNNLGVILALKGDFVSAEKEFKVALRKSSGKSAEAQSNLQFCELYKQNSDQITPAKFQFSRKDSKGD